MESANFLDYVNAGWPIFLGVISLVIVLAKMHSRLESAEEKIKILFELWNNRNSKD